MNKSAKLLISNNIKDTSTNLNVSTLVIPEDVLVTETDTSKTKVGNGVDIYSSLPYTSSNSGGSSVTTLDGWTNFTSNITGNSGTNVVFEENALTLGIKARQVVKFTSDGSNYGYGYIDQITVANDEVTVVIKGDTLPTNPDTIIGFYIGSYTKLAQLNLFVPGLFAENTSSTVLASVAKSYFHWMLPKAYLVEASAICSKHDTSGTKATINIVNSGGFNMLGSSITVSDYITKSNTINIAYRTINPNDPLEISLISTGTTKDSENLTVTLLFVVE